MTMSERVDERRDVRVDDDGQRVRKIEVHEDLAAERRETVGKVARLIWIATSALEFLIGLRVFLKAIAANPNNAFAQFVYGVSELFVWPFNGLTGTPGFEGYVLDIPAILAMFVYAGGAWIVIQLVFLFNRNRATRVSTYEQE